MLFQTIGRRLICLALAGSLAFTAAACGKPAAAPSSTSASSVQSVASVASSSVPEPKSTVPDYMNAEGMPIVKEPVTLRIMSNQNAIQPPFGETAVVQELEKMTGVHVEWELVPMSATKEKKNIVLASGSYPDVFLRVQLDASDMAKYGPQGVFIDLAPYMEYAPNLSALFAERPDILKGLTTPDGKLYALPRLIDADFAAMRTGIKLWYRADWQQKLNLTEPQTTEDFYQMLKAFREKDPNGNGKADEIPLSGMGLNSIINALQGAWGLCNRGSKNHPMVDIQPGGDALRFVPADAEYRDMLNYVHKLYAEGILDKEIFTAKWPQFVGLSKDDQFGAYGGYSPSLLPVQGYEGVAALKGPKGEQLYTAVNPEMEVPFMAAITSSNRYPEVTMKWLDYMYSDEGCKLFSLGIEGVTYTKQSDGAYAFTEAITKNPEGLNMDQARNQFMPSVSGWVGITKEEHFMGSEVTAPALAATAKTLPYHIKEVWPQFIYTEDENKKMIALSSDITNFVNETRDKVIQGSYTFDDKGWSSYLDTLKKMGLDDYMQLYTTAYQRYQG